MGTSAEWGSLPRRLAITIGSNLSVIWMGNGIDEQNCFWWLLDTLHWSCLRSTNGRYFRRSSGSWSTAAGDDWLEIAQSILKTLKQEKLPPVYGFINGGRVAGRRS